MISRPKWGLLAPLVLGTMLCATAPGAVFAQDANTAITIVSTEEPDTMETCHAGYAGVSRVIQNNISETLLDINPANGDLIPRLAKSWEQVNPTTWRFHLVENAKFSDGAPFNADAVVFNIKRIMTPALSCTDGNVHLTAQKVDGFTVDITNDKPDPIMPVRFVKGNLMTSPNSSPDTEVRTPAGTGPYLLAEWVPGVKVVLKRNDNYWGAKPEVSQVTYVFRAESSVRAAMVETGEADIALELTEQDATNPATDIPYVNSETTWLRLDEKYPPFNDVRVRQAVAYAIDRASMQGTVLNKNVLLAEQLPGTSINGYNPDLKPYGYDREKAKALLAEAKADGVPVDAPIRFIGRAGLFANSDEVAQVMNQMLQNVGFNTNLEIMERAREITFQSRPFPQNVGANLIFISSDNDRGDASFNAFGNYDSKGIQSATYDHPDLNALIEKAELETGADRTKDYQQVFQIVHDQAISVPLFYMVTLSRVSERLDWKPTISTNTHIDVQTIKFKK
jgi:peptide/nickel transport system substrate-binding protein